MATVRTHIVITKVVAPDYLGRQIMVPMTKLGYAVAKRMQRLVPKRSWALHDTITSETTRKGGTVTTEVSFGGKATGHRGIVNYGLLVERGTSKMAAQPFARPALLQSKAADLNSSAAAPSRHGPAGGK